MSNSENNRRIAKNTLMLYVRMLLTMVVSLYTSRMVLNTLGVEDFGIYNVVGGIVTMFGFLSGSMSSATQRFLSFELGKKDFVQLGKVYSMSINIHFLIALIIFVFAETVGLWFLNAKLNIPSQRYSAANWVYQFSILSFVVTVISVPYNAAIIAYERMNIFAIVSIIEVVLKLIIVFLLRWFGLDKLKLYAILIFGVSLIMRAIYGIYCRKKIRECRYAFQWDRPLFKMLSNYAAWNLWGSGASVLYNQGINILLNIFFGPAINAARGLAYQVRGAVNNFVMNFQTAMNPQIIKSYAASDLKYMHQLIFQGAKYSFFLLFFFSLPILIETEFILKLWLKSVPDYAIIFTQLVIIIILIDSVSGPLMIAAQASGKIKLYQGVVGGLLMMILPISYLFLKIGYPPESTMIINIIVSLIALFARLTIISPLVKLHISEFVSHVIIKILPVVFVSIVPYQIVNSYIDEGLKRLILNTLSSSIMIIAGIFFLGITSEERNFIMGKVKNFYTR